MEKNLGNSLAVQWLGLGAFTAVGLGSIPGWGTKILQLRPMWHSRKKKKRERENHFAVHQKLIQHCKSTILQLKKKKRK